MCSLWCYAGCSCSSHFARKECFFFSLCFFRIFFSFVCFLNLSSVNWRKHFLSVLRRAGGRNRSSNENVRLAVSPPTFACGLLRLRLKIDGFRIPNLPNIVRAVPGVVAVDCGAEFVIVKCNCSRNDG